MIYDFVIEGFVNPFALFIGDQVSCSSLMFLVGVGTTTEVATEAIGQLLG